MNIVDLLNITKGGRALLDQGESLGLSKGDMVGAFGKLVPALAAGLRHKSQASGQSLEQVLGHLGGEQLADAVEAEEASDLEGFRDQGAQVMTGLFASQDGADTLIHRIAEALGLEASALEAMAPLVAGLFTGVLSKIDSGDFKPSGGGMAGMAATMAVNMLMGSGGGAAGLMKFIDTDSVADLLAGILD